LYFLFWCLLCFLLKTGYYDYQVSMVKKTEYAKNIAALLYSNFKKPICTFYMFKIGFWNSLKLLNQFKGPDNFIFHFVLLFYKEILKVVFVKNDSPIFLFLIHDTKLYKCCPKVKQFLNKKDIE